MYVKKPSANRPSCFSTIQQWMNAFVTISHNIGYILYGKRFIWDPSSSVLLSYICPYIVRSYSTYKGDFVDFFFLVLLYTVMPPPHTNCSLIRHCHLVGRQSCIATGLAMAQCYTQAKSFSTMTRVRFKYPIRRHIVRAHLKTHVHVKLHSARTILNRNLMASKFSIPLASSGTLHPLGYSLECKQKRLKIISRMRCQPYSI